MSQVYRPVIPGQGAGAGGAAQMMPLRVAITGGVSNNSWLVGSIRQHMQSKYDVDSVNDRDGAQRGGKIGIKQAAMGGLLSPYLRGDRL